MSIIYKGWKIEDADWQGYYEGTNLSDCDANMIFGKSVEEVKGKIDDLEE